MGAHVRRYPNRDIRSRFASDRPPLTLTGMDEIRTRSGVAPAQARRDRWIFGGIAASVALVAGAFLAGRASVDAPDCMAAKKLAAETQSAFMTAGQSSSTEEKQKGREPLRQYGYIVTQNPHCFSGRERDTAQQGLDALSQSGG